MSKDRANTIKLGIFVIVSVAIFILAVYILGSQKNMFQPTFRVHAVFNNAKGLKVGNNVRYAGIEAGTVENIAILSDTSIKVTMILQKKVQPYIKKNAVADIGTDGLVGNAIINISPEKTKTTVSNIKNGDVLKTQTRMSTDEMLNTLGATNENIADFSIQLLEISEKINQGQGALNMLLTDGALAGDLELAIRNLRMTSQSLAYTGRQMEKTLAQLEQGDGLLNSLLYDTTVMADLNGFTGQLNQMLEQDLQPLLDNLNQSGQTLAKSSASLQSLLEDLEEGQGLAGALLQDTTMENDIRELIHNTRVSSERLSENMLALREHFLFRKYFRQKEAAREDGN